MTGQHAEQRRMQLCLAASAAAPAGDGGRRPPEQRRQRAPAAPGRCINAVHNHGASRSASCNVKQMIQIHLYKPFEKTLRRIMDVPP